MENINYNDWWNLLTFARLVRKREKTQIINIKNDNVVIGYMASKRITK